MNYKSNTRLIILRIIAFLLVIAITVFIFSIREQAQQLARFGYPGIFLLSLLSNSTVILPAPGLLFVFTFGAVLNPFLVALAAGIGAALGELSGYLAGFSGQAVVENLDTYQKVRNWMVAHQNLSNLTILSLAFIPFPIFDLAGISAGTLKMPVANFLFYCTIGKILKMLVFAYAGATSLKWLIGE